MSDFFPNSAEEANVYRAPSFTVEDFLGEQEQPTFYANEPDFEEFLDIEPIEPISVEEEEIAVTFAPAIEEDRQRLWRTTDGFKNALANLLGNDVITNRALVLEDLKGIDQLRDVSDITDESAFDIGENKKAAKKGAGLF